MRASSIYIGRKKEREGGGSEEREKRREIYYKKLAHAVMEAEESQDPQSASLDPGEPTV